jgi:recombination protein RecT
MTVETVKNAAENKPAGATALIKRHSEDFATVLPSHIKAETWVRLAQGALRRGKRIAGPDSKFELTVAAENNVGVFLATLLDAARLGLEPGTEQYYLTPRKVKGRLEILGIVGYQGYIELMYRAGAISSVIAEVVYSNDKFQYQPGKDEVPNHEIDWDSEDRGELRLVYAYAKMKDGAYSRVVVMNKQAIARVKKSSAGADYDSSPWKTHPEAMWLKSAVRQLAKWVPTSAEYIREQLRAIRDVAAEAPGTTAGPTGPFAPHIEDIEPGIVDGEIVEDQVDPETGELPLDEPA